MGVGLLAAATGTLLLLQLLARDDGLGLGGRFLVVGEELLAQLIRVVGHLDRVPQLGKRLIHGQHERRVVAPDGLGDAVLRASHDDLLLVLHLLDIIRHRGPAVLEVLDLHAQGRLLRLQVGLELVGVAHVELGLVAVLLVRRVPRDAVGVVVGAHELAQLLAVDVARAEVEEAHELLERVPLLLVLLQVVGDIGVARVDVLAGARVHGLRVDDGGRAVGGALALCTAGGGVRGRGRGRVHAGGRVCFEEGHGWGCGRRRKLSVGCGVPGLVCGCSV
jgi:hypothetical protein